MVLLVCCLSVYYYLVLVLLVVLLSLSLVLSIILMNWLDNYKKYIEYNEWAYKIISNKDISDIIRKFIGYEKTIDIIQSIIEEPYNIPYGLSNCKQLSNIALFLTTIACVSSSTSGITFGKYDDLKKH